MEPSTPTPLREPSQETVAEARITAFLARAERASGRRLSAYEHLWQWSTTDLDGFWGTVWDFFGLTDVFGAHGPVLAHEAMPGSRWFPQVSLNYAQFVLTGRPQEPVAIVGVGENDARVDLTWGQLRDQVASLSAWLREHGVGRTQLATEVRDIRRSWESRVRARRGSSTWRAADLLLRHPVVTAAPSRSISASPPRTLPG